MTDLDNTESSLAPTGGGLPHLWELQTGKVLDVLLGVMKTEKTRTQVNDWLYRNTRPGFVFAPPSYELQLTYADQRGGHGTAHWWRLYYGDSLKSQVETILQGTALVAKKQTPTSTNQANSGVRAPYEWGGMYFRSKVEIKVAQELERRGLTFFANIRGRYSLDGSPVSKNVLNGRVELDFLVFHKGNCAILQVDGAGHRDNQDWDYGVDRVMLREGIPTMHFTAQDCLDKVGNVVTEFLAALGG